MAESTSSDSTAKSFTPTTTPIGSMSEDEQPKRKGRASVPHPGGYGGLPQGGYGGLPHGGYGGLPHGGYGGLPQRGYGGLPQGANGDIPQGENGDIPQGENGDVPPGENGDIPPGENGDVPPGENGDVPPGENGGLAQHEYGGERRPLLLPAGGEVPQLCQRGDEQVPTCTCSLIPKWTTKHWKCCTTVYSLGIAVCVVLFLVACALIGFWVDRMNETGKHRTMWVSTMNEVYDMNTPHSHLYSEEVCISMADGSLPSDYHIQLAREDCSKVETTTKTFNINGSVAPSNTISPGVRMFYGLNGTSFEMSIDVPWEDKNNNITMYLLTDYAQAHQCNTKKPTHAVDSWTLTPHNKNICSSVRDKVDAFKCKIPWTASKSNHYYICFYKNQTQTSHNITSHIVKYYLTIDLVYDNIPLKNRATCNLTRPNDTCCTSYNNIFMELHTQTCIFITSVPAYDSTDVGIPIEVNVWTIKRKEVMWYLVGLALVCLLLATVLGVVATCTVYKGRHKESRGCTCMCSLYGPPE